MGIGYFGDYESPSPYKQFETRDVQEVGEVENRMLAYLSTLLVRSRVSAALIEAAVRQYGWKRTQQLIASTQPTLATAQRGELGEVVSCAMLTEFFGYSILVSKLCFAITANATLPSTDAIAVKSSAGNLTEVCFVESKLRVNYDSSVAKKGYAQLVSDYSKKFPDMIRFVTEQLLREDDPQANSFLSYLFDRRETVARESFFLALTSDQAAWSENSLANLEAEITDPTLPRVMVAAVRIKGLEKLSDELFRSIGITQVLEDDSCRIMARARTGPFLGQAIPNRSGTDAGKGFAEGSNGQRARI